jgi:hypothetical protein
MLKIFIRNVCSWDEDSSDVIYATDEPLPSPLPAAKPSFPVLGSSGSTKPSADLAEGPAVKSPVTGSPGIDFIKLHFGQKLWHIFSSSNLGKVYLKEKNIIHLSVYYEAWILRYFEDQIGKVVLTTQV